MYLPLDAFGISFSGYLRPFESWGQNRVAIHLAQQGKQPLCQFEEGIQGHLLAGGDYSILPVYCPPQRVHDSAELLH